MTKKPKAAVVTHGCRYNQFESAEIGQHLQDEGFEVISDSRKADLYVINTCTVTGKSDYKSRQSIRKASAINKDATIVVTGCYSQMYPEEIADKTEVDLIIGNREKYSLTEYLKRTGLIKEGQLRKKNGPARIFVSDISKEREFLSLPVSQIPGRTKAFLKVQSGCDQTCSFCVVTLARGDSVSEKPENVVGQFETLIHSGFREITLTGIHLGSYGKDLRPETSLSGLLERLLGVEGDFRIRLSSLGPMEVDERLIDLIRENPKICRSFHLPLQSGDGTILRLMRRNYTPLEYRKVFRKVTSEIEDIGIGADVMAGFPGETAERFQKTLELVEELPFAYLHVFHYSERPGTDAVNLPDKIPTAVSQERAKQLKELGLKKTEDFRKRFLGTSRVILVEGKRDRATGLLKGHTDNYIPVLAEGNSEMMNRLAVVRLTRMEGLRVFGEFMAIQAV